MKRYAPIRLHILVDLPARTVRAEFRYWPARKAPHAGADGPRYMGPGRADGVDELHLFDEHLIEVSSEYGPRTMGAIKEAVRLAARVHPMPVRVSPRPEPAFYYGERETDQFPLIEAGVLGGAS